MLWWGWGFPVWRGSAISWDLKSVLKLRNGEKSPISITMCYSHVTIYGVRPFTLNANSSLFKQKSDTPQIAVTGRSCLAEWQRSRCAPLFCSDDNDTAWLITRILHYIAAEMCSRSPTGRGLVDPVTALWMQTRECFYIWEQEWLHENAVPLGSTQAFEGWRWGCIIAKSDVLYSKPQSLGKQLFIN